MTLEELLTSSALVYAHSQATTTRMPLPYVKTDGEFSALLKAHPVMIANFTASWCGPCKMISPQIETLAKENPDVFFCKIDVDENDETPAKLYVARRACIMLE
jgi:thiol-disulfide isomerase/thioredoxin